MRPVSWPACYQPGPAIEILHVPADQTDGLWPAWAVFDAQWYREAYGRCAPALTNASDAATLDHYLSRGAAAGQAPNPFFDESFYLASNPDVAGAVAARRFLSGFDHYCQLGYRDRSPHWLFDMALYASSPDLTEEAIGAAGFANRYAHFLAVGAREGRVAHVLFDPASYRPPPRLQTGLGSGQSSNAWEHLGAQIHFLRMAHADDRHCRTSVYFDSEWYLNRYPSVRSAIETGDWLGPLHHYLRNPEPAAFDPLPWFTEDWYRARHPHVASRIASGAVRTGYEDFLARGVFALRAPSPKIDLCRYVAASSLVRADLGDWRFRDVFAHFLSVGLPLGLASGPAGDAAMQPGAAAALAAAQARACLPLQSRHRLDFLRAGQDPALSVVISGVAEPATLWRTLAALHQGTSEPLEILLADGDEAAFAGRVSGVRRGMVAGASASTILLLAADAMLDAAALTAARRRLDSDPSIGAVTGKVIGGDGQLLEAGRDTSGGPYMAGLSPLAPEANFVRDVASASPDFVVIRAASIMPSGEPASTVRVRPGQRIVYDPSVIVTRTVCAPPCALGSFAARPNARSPMGTGARILFIEDTLPLRRIGSGFVRSNDIVRAIADLGAAVTLFPVNGCRFDLAAVYADMPDTVEALHDRAEPDLDALLAERAGCFDIVWIARTHNLERLHRTLSRYCGRIPWVLDTEAVVSARRAARALLDGEDFDLSAAISAEFTRAPLCRRVVAVSAAEAGLLRAADVGGVSVLGHARALAPTTGTGFSARAGLLFVGAIHEAGSPNHDSLIWLIEQVLPLVAAVLGPEARLTVAGHLASDVNLERFAGHPGVRLLGAVDDLSFLYEQHRVFVAPTRFAAGIPYKVHEAASFGLPVVATSLLADQLGWTDGVELLASPQTDAADFAAAIVTLYRSEPLWTRLRDAALERLKVENDPEVYRGQVADLLAATVCRASNNIGS